MFKKIIIFLSILCICFLAIASVSANDSVETFYTNSTDFNSNLEINEVFSNVNSTSNNDVSLDIHSSEDFLNFADDLGDYNNQYAGKTVIVNLDSNKTYEFNSNIKDTHLHNRIIDDYGFVMRVNDVKLIINGNGSNIKNTDEHSLGFLYINNGATVFLENLTISDFKLGIVNDGDLFVNKCTFKNNVNDVFYTPNALLNQEGAAVHNNNYAVFNECTFDSNRAHAEFFNDILRDYIPKGSAVFADANSRTFLLNCIYKSLKDNVFVNDDAFVFINDTMDNVWSVSDYVFKKSEKSSVCIKSFNNTQPSVYSITVLDDDGLKHALNIPHFETWGIKINVYYDIHLSEDLLLTINEPVEITTRGCTIYGNGDSSFIVNKNTGLQVSNANFENFNVVFENHGSLICKNCNFNNNNLAIDNCGGTFNCTDCEFNERLGSIHSEGKTVSYIVNCHFNKGEGLSFWESLINWVPAFSKQEVDVFSVDSKIILVNTTCSYDCDKDNGGIISKRNNLDPVVKHLTVSDSKSLRDAANKVWEDNGASDQIIIDFTNSNDLAIDSFNGNLFHPRFVTLVFNGKGNVIKAKNNDEDDLFKFLYVEKNCVVGINNLTLSHFNTAILNHGTCVIANSILKDNRINTMVKEDYGGAIDNRGNLVCFNCTFVNNYAKYGGAVYNSLGYCQLINCTFNNNLAYASDGCNDIYNHNSAFCELVNSTTSVDINNCYGLSKMQKDLLMGGTQVGTIVLSFGAATVATSMLLSAFGVVAASVTGTAIGTVAGSAVGIFGVCYNAYDSQAWNGLEVGKGISKSIITALSFSSAGANLGYKLYQYRTAVRVDVVELQHANGDVVEYVQGDDVSFHENNLERFSVVSDGADSVGANSAGEPIIPARQIFQPADELGDIGNFSFRDNPQEFEIPLENRSF